MASTDTAGQLSALPVDLLQRGSNQPRTDFDKEALQELAESIKAQGVLQPVMVRPLGDSGKYEIIAGERRWRAAQLAGLHEIPAVVRELDDQTAMCIALIENIQREDLNPLEQARGLARLAQEFDMTHDDIAGSVGRSRSAVTNMLRLLELCDDVKRLLESRQLEMGHARALLTLSEQQQKWAAQQIIKSGLSVRGAETLARRLQKAKTVLKPWQDRVDPDVKLLETELSEQLGAAVSIQQRKQGKGTLRIAYDSLAQLDGILDKIRRK
jgi:ParB family chromosome partitioning protein